MLENTQDFDKRITGKILSTFQGRPDAVIMDSYTEYTYDNLAKAINYLKNPKVQFFTLSGDDRFRGGADLLMPDVGAFRVSIFFKFY